MPALQGMASLIEELRHIFKLEKNVNSRSAFFAPRALLYAPCFFTSLLDIRYSTVRYSKSHIYRLALCALHPFLLQPKKGTKKIITHFTFFCC
jgi:hypothetical protein